MKKFGLFAVKGMNIYGVYLERGVFKLTFDKVTTIHDTETLDLYYKKAKKEFKEFTIIKIRLTRSIFPIPIRMLSINNYLSFSLFTLDDDIISNRKRKLKMINKLNNGC